MDLNPAVNYELLKLARLLDLISIKPKNMVRSFNFDNHH